MTSKPFSSTMPHRPAARRRLPVWTAGLGCALGLGLAQAEIVEEVVDVPVSVVNAYGLKVEHPIKVTVFRETSRDRSPYLVLNHGRPASEADFAQMKRQRFSALSRYFVGLGFTVLVPTRVGYGDTGGPDVEHSGRCDSRNYPPVYAAAADETEQLLGALARHPGVSLERGLVVGQSFGGLTTLALSARRLPGLVAGVNFAGGGGGNPSEHPGNPCSAGRLARLFRQYGEQAQVPTLWFYSENDRFWGAQLPKDWAAGYNEAGGRASFVSLPPYKADGHGSFAGQPEAWKPAFEQFLRAQGFSLPESAQPTP